MSKRKTRGIAIVALLGMGLTAGLVQAHCQIPCGIYDDDARLAAIAEHIGTIEKSILQIQALSADRKPNHNQLVRWVMNKETHADAIAEIVTYYFMAQRVKPADPTDQAAQARYVQQLTLLHQMLVASMKAKQTADTTHTKKLKELLDGFAHAYGSKAHKH